MHRASTDNDLPFGCLIAETILMITFVNVLGASAASLTP